MISTAKWGRETNSRLEETSVWPVMLIHQRSWPRCPHAVPASPPPSDHVRSDEEPFFLAFIQCLYPENVSQILPSGQKSAS